MQQCHLPAMPQIKNLSAEPLGKLHSWIPHDLKEEELVFLPHACPGKSPLPTGTAVLTCQADRLRSAISDCGCGMRLLRSSVPVKDLDAERWNAVANHLRAKKDRLGTWAEATISSGFRRRFQNRARSKRLLQR